MKKKFINTARIEGYVYQHTLALKKVENSSSPNFGKEFISGNLSIATDEDCVNVINVHYTYVTATTKSNTPNRTYAALKKVMEGPTVVENSKDEALKVRADTSIALNDFYDDTGALKSSMKLEGGFITVINALDPDVTRRNTFTADIVIGALKKVEANEEANIPQDYLDIKGYIFDFRSAVMPTTFRIRSVEGMNYFESLNPTGAEPVFTKIWGEIISQTIVTTIEEASAFGTPSVRQVTRSNKEYLVTGTAQEAGVFNDPSTITVEELQKALQDREIYLADVKKRQDEYAATKKTNEKSTPAAAPIANSNFEF